MVDNVVVKYVENIPPKKRGILDRIVDLFEEHRIYIMVFGGFFLAITIIVISIFVLMWSNSCNDLNCHIEKAMACEEGNFTNAISNITMSFSVDGSCVLTKKIIKLDDNEPKEIVDLFLNKSMNCTKPFNRELFTTLTGGMENCMGELKENLFLVMASLEQ